MSQYQVGRLVFGPEGPRPKELTPPARTREQAYDDWGVINVPAIGLLTVPIINANVFKINRCTITADVANAGVVYVAESAPSAAKGVRLPAGVGQNFFINDLSKIKLSASMAGQLALVTWYR